MTQRVSEDPTLVALGSKRARVWTAIEGYGSRLFDLGQDATDYREALRRCDVPADVLTQARDELVGRLEAGWDASEIDGRLDDRWVGLLVRYEAVCDALDVAAAGRRLSVLEARCYQAA